MGREVRGLQPNLCPRQAQTVTRADGAAVATQLFVSTENDVLAAQAQLMAASFAGDCARCEPFLTSDCAFIRATPTNTVEVVLRDAWLAEVGRAGAISASITDNVVSAHGHLAVATVYWLVDADPALRSVTDVWTRNEAGRWQLAERHEHPRVASSSLV